MNITLRKATIDDMKMVNEITNHYINSTSFNWDQNEISLEETQNKFSTFDKRHPFYIAQIDEKTDGFGNLTTFRSKDGYKRIVEL